MQRNSFLQISGPKGLPQTAQIYAKEGTIICAAPTARVCVNLRPPKKIS
ncbi:hypothetical protein NIASO_06230 [Niabella soli DSM 19437]|uniref:Uncharacterized protein n=1 Tax=Niabella soli DSM 19437 TaxID=929713 RepID=W0F6D5_9BACT|nr:hypothetical protein NIASO_06230 [Niabella soli DSM 19437]